jgi:hypothetical protein
MQKEESPESVIVQISSDVQGLRSSHRVPVVGVPLQKVPNDNSEVSVKHMSSTVQTFKSSHGAPVLGAPSQVT